MTFEAVSKKEGSFISPFWDFICVGGLTFFFMPVFLLFDIGAFAFGVIAIIIYALALVNDNPHFMFSYQVMYENFSRKLSADNTLSSRFRYLFSGVIVPILLICFYIYGYLHGAQNQNTLMLGYAINAMVFFVGWHYVKQGYGVLITFSVKRRLFFADLEKKILLYNAYAVWVAVWLFSNRFFPVHFENFYIPYTPVHIPFDGSLFVFAGLLSILLVSLVFLRRLFKGNIIWNGWVGYLCAVYLWMIALYYEASFVLVVPALHSLQYLLFIGKLTFEKRRGEDQKVHGFLGFAAISGILGVLSLLIVPVSLDLLVPYDRDVFGPALFMMMFVVFISIHHYFIDFAIWRKDNPDMKYLYQ